MITIIIEDLQNMEFKEVYQYLMLANETSFEIHIQREAAWNTPEEPDMHDWSNLFAYYRAAYAGQKLYEISSHFNYWVPSVETVSPFRFEIEITDIEKFADVLYYIVVGLFNLESQEWEESFENQATIFHGAAWEFEIDVACWGLVYIAGDYLNKVSKD